MSSAPKEDAPKDVASKGVAKGYWIGRVDVHDLDAYKRYVEANAAVFAEYGAKFLVRAGQFENPEGSARSRNVVLEFDSYERAPACYHSEAYQAIIPLRADAGVSQGDVIVIEGYTG
ncbi:MAG: DUF1330 domain-containing protein [Pseudomonadota bacterium]